MAVACVARTNSAVSAGQKHRAKTMSLNVLFLHLPFDEDIYLAQNTHSLNTFTGLKQQDANNGAAKCNMYYSIHSNLNEGTEKNPCTILPTAVFFIILL